MVYIHLGCGLARTPRVTNTVQQKKTICEAISSNMCALQELNPQPSGPKPLALSS